MSVIAANYAMCYNVIGTERGLIMKVLHIIGGGDIGGAKSHVLSLINELGKHIDAKLISLRTGAFADDAKKMGINVEIVRTGTIFTDIRMVLEIIRKEGYELIHSHGAKANMIAVYIKKATGLPIVTTVHSDYRLDYLQNILKMFSFGLVNTMALRFIDYHIGVSRNFKEMLIKRRFSPTNIFTVYNGIDFSERELKLTKREFLSKYNLNFNDSDIIVGILARLDPVKGLGTFLQAAKVVVEKKPSVKFLIAGDGNERKSLERKAASLGLNGKVFFLGFINEPLEFVNSIDINVLTSLSESFPYAILEGTLFKKATVSSNVGGISDLIENGINGFLFEPGDYKTFAGHLLALAENKQLREDMGNKIHAKASSQFSLESMCRTQLDIYETILAREHKNSISKYRFDAIISGYYGFNNIGDDAMLKAIIDSLRTHDRDIRITVLSRNPIETRQIYDVNSINRFNIFHIMRVMRRTRLFINGGGSLIQDNTSTRSLIYYLLMIWMAKKMGMKVMIYANGIGPLKRETNRRLTTSIVNRVDVVTLREELSLIELKNLGINKPKVIVTADPALTIEPCSKERIDRMLLSEGIDPNDEFIGFSVRKWSGHEKYVDTIARIADYIIDEYNIKPLFIPMHYPGDLAIAESIISKMRGKGYIISRKPGVSEMLGIIGRTQILIGMRLHALIFAASLGIPIVGIVYEPKVEGFLQYTNQISAGHINDLEFEKLKEIVDKVWAQRQQIREDLEAVTVELKKKARQNALLAVELMENRK